MSMFRNIFLCLIVCLSILNLSFARSDTHINYLDIPSSSSDNDKTDISISSILLTPITTVGIVVASVVMAPVGFFEGVSEGASVSSKLFDNGREDKEPFYIKFFKVPVTMAGFATSGAIYMAAKESKDTTVSLSDKAIKSGYMV